MSIGENNTAASNKGTDKRPGKRPGRKPSKIDERAKLERSRQSARECRARKKLRYQYLEELVVNREKAVFALRDELEMYKQWCIQLESGGHIPEALLKMIASEETSAQRRQIEQATRSLLQQQRQQQQQFQLSSSSSSTSSTSPEMSPSSSNEHQHHQHNRQVSVVQPQSTFPQSSHAAQIQGYIPVTSSSPNHKHQRQLLQQATSTAPLQRQIAFDYTGSKDPEKQIQQLTNDSVASSHRPSANQLQQHLLPKHLQYPAKVNNMLMSKKSSSIPESVYLYEAYTSRTSQEQFMSQVKSESPFKCEHNFEGFRLFPNTTSSNSQQSLRVKEQHDSQAIRGRSLSNPTSMTSFTRPSLPITSAKDMPSPLQDFITAHSSSSITRDQSSMGFGLFSGHLIGSDTLSSSLSNINPITVEDSSSSDENVNEKQLFLSSLSSQKRTSSVPFLPENPKRPLMDTNTLSLTSVNYDPQTRLENLTNVNCFDATKTSNTPSPSSSGLPSSCVPSPTPSPRYSGMSSSTPSSSTASPAPLLSLSSLLDFSASSPAMSSAAQGALLEITGQPSVQPNLPSSSTSECSSTNLGSFLSYQTPEWYSFLDDLQDGVMSTYTSRHGASSNHGTPTALTPRQQDQPLTPDPSFMNVPNIIDEILDSDDQML